MIMRGFTLVEMIIVIALVSFVGSIAVWGGAGVYRQSMKHEVVSETISAIRGLRNKAQFGVCDDPCETVSERIQDTDVTFTTFSSMADPPYRIALPAGGLVQTILIGPSGAIERLFTSTL